MKNLLRVLVIFSSVLYSHPIIAQSNNYAVPENFIEAGDFFGDLCPIGWSQNEFFFAWLRYNIDTGEADPPEGYFLSLIIQDVRDDKIVYNKNIYGYEFCGDKDCDFTLDSIWQVHGQAFELTLNKYGIIQNQRMKWVKFPLSLNNSTYKIKLESEKHNYGNIVSEKIFIISDSLGSKVIYDETYNYDQPLHSEISGGFISPSSKRLIIVKKSKKRGFEEERLLLPSLIGCHLTYGFK